MTLAETEDRILATLREEYDRTGQVDWWAARDLCLAAAVPEELFGPAVEAMARRRLLEARVDPGQGRSLRLSRIVAPGTARTLAAAHVGPPHTGRLAAWLSALLRPFRELVP